MKSFFCLMLLASTVLFWQCGKEPAAPSGIDFSCVEHPDACALAEANSDFAIRVFKQINSEEAAGRNIFISPFSISTALAMTANGAAGTTLDAMRNTLALSDLDMARVNAGYKTLLYTLPKLDPDTRLKLANSIWPRLQYPVLGSFLQTNTNYFDSAVLPVDFGDPAVLGQVNQWVENQTDGLIKNTLTELDPGVVMLLINAIYFKGSWHTKFDPAQTKPADFLTADGAVKTDMMHLPEGTFPYFHNDLFQAIDLPYGDSVYSMSIFLPNPGHDVQEIVGALNGDSWRAWTAAFQPRAVELFMPKFKLEYGIKLKSALSQMGMGLAFSDAADFSNMVNGGGVKIDDVIHKAFVEVDEKGTEAAAVTVVVIIETSAYPNPVVKLDRPFLLVIRDNKTNSILFMGKMMHPGA